ncbi:probable protein S-acyltransferase 16 isoform X2 [Magnolia sinica]|uniref:probable protein S-acyltransferase 16 isoform X2 n=1 Tax=Magnolia sinica TaxID=86752 RepID=UPI00265B00F1|nr:probable protein S-acyltransferase 16 isoform X2 [Magnolia sinica]
MRRSYISLPIIVVLSTIFLLYYLMMFFVIDEWLGLKTSQGLFNAVALTVFVCMSLSTYAMAIVRDPGHVPPSFMPDVEDPDSPLHEIKRKGGDLRYCQKCSHYKPPRAHHCRICRRCVLRMDHHCVWINNCVGHANYKIFLVFVLYGVIACIHCTILLVGSVLNNVHTDPSGGSYKFVYIISGVLLFPLTAALTVLLGWHVYLLLSNKTTIEYHEGVRAMWLAEKVGNSYRHPYDLGAYENLVSVLGTNVLTWLCPTSSHTGSGLRFRTSFDSTHSSSPRGHV